MAPYSQVFKMRVLQRLVGPQAVSANRLAAEVGVPQETLSRWLRATRSVEGMSQSPKWTKSTKWTSAEKLRVVLAAQGVRDAELGLLLRREGLHAAQLAEWQALVAAALEAPRARALPSADTQRIAALERELLRKDRALAETAALLVLKKKAQAIWGDADDTTDPRTER